MYLKKIKYVEGKVLMERITVLLSDSIDQVWPNIYPLKAIYFVKIQSTDDYKYGQTI